jgi:UDP-2,3-diacylglucosamine hydrolase
MRFDVPTVGPQTLQQLIAGGATVLAIEAGTTLMVHRQECIARADAHRIAVVGVSAAVLQQHGV